MRHDAGQRETIKKHMDEALTKIREIHKPVMDMKMVRRELPNAYDYRWDNFARRLDGDIIKCAVYVAEICVALKEQEQPRIKREECVIGI